MQSFCHDSKDKRDIFVLILYLIESTYEETELEVDQFAYFILLSFWLIDRVRTQVKYLCSFYVFRTWLDLKRNIETNSTILWANIFEPFICILFQFFRKHKPFFHFDHTQNFTVICQLILKIAIFLDRFELNIKQRQKSKSSKFKDKISNSNCILIQNVRIYLRFKLPTFHFSFRPRMKLIKHMIELKSLSTKLYSPYGCIEQGESGQISLSVKFVQLKGSCEVDHSISK